MLYIQTVEPLTLGLLKRLMADEVLNHFVLVGGTALSLQIGHRKSIDLDFFTHQDFEASSLLQHLIDENYKLHVLYNFKQTLILEIEGIKVDFIRFRYPFSEPLNTIENIRLAAIQDIASMKIDAIVGRGRKKDFCDLFYLLQIYSLADLIIAYQHMFQHSTLFHVYKSLTWFEDADTDAEPDVFDSRYGWENAKAFIIKAIEATI